jgi:hypothetical protein
MAEAPKKDPRTVTFKRVRLAFADGLVEQTTPKGVDDAQPKFNAQLLIECVGDDAKARAEAEGNKARALGGIEAACDQQWGKKDRWKTIQEDSPKRIAFRKGERFKNDDGEVYLGYAGNFVVSAAGPGAGKRRPKLFDRHRQEVTGDEAKLKEKFAQLAYSGCYADAIVSFYGGDKGGVGVFASIDAIRSWEEGARTGGGGYVASADDFDAADDEGAFDTSTDALG